MTIKMLLNGRPGARALSMLALPLLAAGAMMTPAHAAPYKKVTLILSSASPPSMEDSRALKVMASDLKKETDGALQLKLYLSSSLFTEGAGLKAANAGNVDMSIACTCNFTPLTSVFKFGDVPYIFKSTQGARKVWDGGVGQEAAAALSNKTNLKVLAYTPSGGGPRLLFNSRHVVKVPADLHGLKIRTTATPIEQNLLKAWGAEPTFVDVGDLYSSLQQHVVDGYHIQPWWAWTLKLYQTTPYATDVKAEYVYRALVINKKSWGKLDPGEQKLMLAAVKTYEQDAYKFNAQERTKGFALLKKNGVSIYEPSAAELGQWRQKALEIRSIAAIHDSVPQKLIKKIENLQK